MPSNQSSPWDGRKPRPLPGGPATAAVKVPSAVQTCDGLSTRTDRAKDQSLWGGGARDHTATSWRCSTTVPPAPPGPAPPGPGPPRGKCYDGASGRPTQLIRRPNTNRADSSMPPPQCLQHQHASSSSSSSPSPSPSSRAPRRIFSGKVFRRRPGVGVASLSVRGRPPAGSSSAGAGNKPGGADQEAQLTDSVTWKMSSICLTTPAPPAPPAGSSLPAPHGAGAVTPSGHRWSVGGMQEEEEPDEEQENNLSDDGESDCCSITATSSCTSIAAPCSIEESMSAEDGDERPALVPSLFPLVAPTLYFSTANEKVELLPAEQRRLLKWKMSTVTPNVVKHTVARSHFKVTKKSSDWLGCWGHHMKSAGFKTLAEHQKLNHFPGTFQIGRKDRLWRNLSKMQLRFGKQEFGFFPRTFVLPQDIKLLRKAWEDGGSRQKWIVKPPASARGIGIQVIHKWSQLPRKRPLLVQKYLHKPYLIGGNKFDLRIYVYVTCYDPLRVYVFSDGLVRFASCKYSSSMKTLGNKFMHLTNYSVNKKNAEYQSNSDDQACQGHKWALKALWRYLGARGVDTAAIWEEIKDIIIKTIIASEPYVNTLLKMNVRSAYSCHELFGFDVMLDENLKPWILEVNISPSLHSNTPLDVSIKGQMIRDLLNLAGFRIPPREEVLSPCSTSSSSSSVCGGVRRSSDRSADEKVKRAFYLTQRCSQDFLSSMLDMLTPEDVRVLVESEDELSRRGDFQRIFPAPSSPDPAPSSPGPAPSSPDPAPSSPSPSRYLRFFECPRYLNLLLDRWEQTHWRDRSTGVGLLRTLCQRGVHLGTSDSAHLGTSDSAHLWSRCEDHQDPLTPSRSRVVVTLHSEEDPPDQDPPHQDGTPGPESSLCSSVTTPTLAPPTLAPPTSSDTS